MRTQTRIQLMSIFSFMFIIFSCFYRATLCVSAVFAVARCTSVGPSDTLAYCINTAEDIVKRHFWSRIDSNRKPYIIYRMVPLSMILSDLWPGFQGHDIFWNQISEKLRNTIRKPYVWWPWLTFKRVAQFVSDSWVSCFIARVVFLIEWKLFLINQFWSNINITIYVFLSFLMNVKSLNFITWERVLAGFHGK